MLANTLGFYGAVLTSFAAAVTFAIAILTPPLSGPFCMGACFAYPYLDVASRFPRDYIWMYPAIMLVLVYVVLMTCIHRSAAEDKKIFSLAGLSCATMSAVILAVNYFVQVSVIQPSVLNGEADGIALLTQFNPHGIFIALEELGFFLMSLSLFFIAPVFSGVGIARAIRWICIAGFTLTCTAFILISALYGIHREYRFEVAVISINWSVLIVIGILLSVVFRRRMKSDA